MEGSTKFYLMYQPILVSKLQRGKIDDMKYLRCMMCVHRWGFKSKENEDGRLTDIFFGIHDLPVDRIGYTTDTDRQEETQELEILT